MEKKSWLNKNIFALGLTSFFSDFGHEMATAILPAFIVSIGGSAALLGLIEGFADASISFMKLFAGWYSDFIKKRKPFALIGYFLTAIGVGSFAFATNWWLVLGDRMVAWVGRGMREPPRDALLTESANEKHYGRVFGFHRMMDTLGAVCGPLIAFILIKIVPLRSIFLIAFIPSLLAFFTVFFLVKEAQRSSSQPQRFRASLRVLPPRFRIFLLSVGLFGLGNFADSLLILRATELMKPAQGALVAGSLAILLYAFHNVLYAVSSYPIGFLADRFNKKTILSFGYLLTGFSSAGFIFASSNAVFLGLLFLIAGLAIAITDALERAVAADIIPQTVRGTGYGVLATVNGVGDFVSSSMVGYLWNAISPLVGFGYGAVLMISGATLLFFQRNN